MALITVVAINHSNHGRHRVKNLLESHYPSSMEHCSSEKKKKELLTSSFMLRYMVAHL